MSNLFDKWLSMNSRLEDLKQYSQIKRSSSSMRKQQCHSFALMCVFLGIPLQPSLSVAVRGCFLYWAIYN